MSNYNLFEIKLGLKPKEPKKVKPIAKVSKKQRKANKKLSAIVKDLMLVNPLCELKTPVCTMIAEGSDHTVKRSPKNLLDKNNIKLSCNACNTWKESHSKEAKEMGISKSKFSPVLLASHDKDLQTTIIEKG